MFTYTDILLALCIFRKRIILIFMNIDRNRYYEKMTATPASRLVLSLGFPTTVSMLVTNIYNVADTFFVGLVGTSASAAVGVVFGLQAIFQAVGFMHGHGAGSNIARHLGKKEVDEASVYASTSFFLALAAGLLFIALGFLCIDPLCRLFGSTDTILPYAREYAFWIFLAAPAMTVGCVTNNILRYEGRAALAMVGLVSGGIINIFLDWLMVCVFHTGVSGAGFATMISQYIAVVIFIFMFLSGKTQSRLSIKAFSKTSREICFDIWRVGSPSLTRQGLHSISAMVLNNCAAVWGDAAVAAMAIVGKLSNFLFCVAVGIGQGFQPVSAFNYGAGKYSRVHTAFFTAAVMGTVFLSAFALAAFIFAPELVRAMRNDEKVVSIGAFALRAACASLPFVPLSIVGEMLFQSTGFAGKALLISSLRSGVLFIPIVIVCSVTMELFGLEISQSTANVLACFLSLPVIVRFLKRLPEDEE